ncbi:MAG: TIGR03936 family radical SAM-associated protein [Spirochaetales bacterium]
MTIDPVRDLHRILLEVENPGRYVGGEFGSRKKSDPILRVGVGFPDLYEIGMANQAIATLYGLIHSIEGATAERVFCPAPDFEQALKQKSIPLYGLEEGTPLNELDLLTITLSYELSATNVLLLLQAGGIPLLKENRTSKDPLVIGGGPASTNPIPFGKFFDGIFIGEAEEEFARILPQLVQLKKQGAAREDLLVLLRSSPSFWYEGKTAKTVRSIFRSFSFTPSYTRFFPVPNLRTAQDHGVVEIMRGCPNGCRFCHAGIYYRPFRMKPPSLVEEEVCWEVEKKGYREITLASLSSGDYKGLDLLMKKLNTQFRHRFVSFSLPSLHIETFGLDLLADISEVRKSGLTFAIETANPLWQQSLNKKIEKETVIQVVKQAKEKGWKLAKFYFMVGLPFQEPQEEALEIIEFISEIQRVCQIQINLNVGTFVPKPHTPFQWARQITEEEAVLSIQRVRKGLRHLPVKVGYQSPFCSFLEGVISRGDERVGELILQAFINGARFDAWEDRLNRQAWVKALEQSAWNVKAEALRERSLEELLPWRAIDLGITTTFLKKEYQRAAACQETFPCDVPCKNPCGVCSQDIKPLLETLSSISSVSLKENKHKVDTLTRKLFYRYVISYEKVGKAAFIPHLSLLTIFERALQRSGFSCRFSTGFNPKPYIEFAQPLTLGYEGLEEVVSVELMEEIQDEYFLARFNSTLPEGLVAKTCFHICYREGEKKPLSIMSLFKGGRYLLSFLKIPNNLELLSACIMNNTLKVNSVHILNCTKPLPNLKIELDAKDLKSNSKVKSFYSEILHTQAKTLENYNTLIENRITLVRKFCYGPKGQSLFNELKDLYLKT